MVQAVEKKKYVPRFRTKAVLKAIGLPFTAHWPEVSLRIKDLIVSARRANDMEQAAVLSEYKAFLKRNINRDCARCKKPVAPGSLRCRLCDSIVNPGHRHGN